MSEWKNYFLLLRCLNCRGILFVTNVSKNFNKNPLVNGELICHSCKKRYPIFQDIPVMFKEDYRTRILIDSIKYEYHLKKAIEKIQQASQMTGDELNQFKNGDGLEDALSWEILFWERWKQADIGFVEFSKNKIVEFLEKDDEGGGRLKFLNRTLFFCEDIFNKHLLNVGTGRDFLLEKFLEKGCEVIEQDIVLEPLLFLKKRKANFCVCCDARNLPFEDNTFDISTSFGVLHHIWPIEKTIIELLRVTSGIIHFNEPNYFSLTRAALLFPKPIKRKLKYLYSGDHSRSPYENTINPYLFKKIVENKGAKILDLSFAKSSWINKDSKGIMKYLRAINLILVNVLPLTSSHFDVVIRKTK